MNNNVQNQQNGRQRPLPPDQTSPQQSSSSDGICRDFVWGICGKGTQCRFRHVLNFESMKRILKFCHNFQNKRGCNSCTYLHTSSEEETLFLRTGQIPRVLRERYATMALSNPGNVYLNEILSQPPPPPPPLPPQPVQSPRSTLLRGMPPLPAPLSSLLAPPPPPPPPTATTTVVQMTPPIFTGPIQVNATTEYQANLIPSLQSIPEFDASRPPPPLPSTSVVHLPNGTLKRSADTVQAGPSKCRKVEGASVVDHSQCEKCSHRKTRADEFTEQARTLEYGERYQKCIIEQKREAIENGKLLLESVLSPGMYRIWDEYIEGSSSSERHYIDDILNIAQNIISAGARPSTFGNDSELSIQTILKRVLNANNTENFEGDNRNINNLASMSSNMGNSSPMAGSTAGISRQPINIATGSLQSVSSASTSALASEIAAPSSSAAAHLPNGANVQQNVPTTHIQAHAQNVSYFLNTRHPQPAANIQNGSQLQNAAHHQNVSQSQSIPQGYNAANMPNVSQPQNDMRNTSQSHNVPQSQIRFRFRNSAHHQSVSHQNVRHVRNQQDVNRYQQNGPQMQAFHSPNVTHMQAAAYSQNGTPLQAGGSMQNMNHRQAAGPSQNINLQPPAPPPTQAVAYSQNGAHMQAGGSMQNMNYRQAAGPSQNINLQPTAPPPTQAVAYSQNGAHLQAGGSMQKMNHRHAAGPSQNINLQPPAPPPPSQHGTSVVTPPTAYEQQYQAGVPQPSTSYAPYVVAPNNVPNRPYSSPRTNAANQTNVQQADPSAPSTSSSCRFPFNIPRFPGPQPPPPQ